MRASAALGGGGFATRRILSSWLELKSLSTAGGFSFQGVVAVNGSKLLSRGATSVPRTWLGGNGDDERGWASAGGKIRSGRFLPLGGAGHRFASQSARSVGGAPGGEGTSPASPSSGSDGVGDPQQGGGGPNSGRAGNHGRSAPPSGSGKPSLGKILSKAKDAEHEAKLIFLQLQQLRGDDQLDFLHDVCEAGKANVFHFNTVIGRCTYEESSQLIRRMLQLGVEPDRLTYLRFIQKAVMRGEMDVAEATLVRLEEAKIRPNAEIYTTVIHGYGRIADYKQVRATWDRMLEDRVRPDEKAYLVMIDIYAKMGDMAEAERIMATMMSPRGVGTSVRAFTSLIHGYTRLGMLREVENAWERFRATGVGADTGIYNAMITAYDKMADLPNVIACAQEMEQNGVAKDLITFTAVMDAYGKRALAKEASLIFDRMQEEGFKPDAIAMSAIINNFGHTGRVKEAVDKLKELKDTYSDSPVVAHASNAIVDAFCKEGKMDKAESLVQHMRESGGPHDKPTIHTYMSLICGYRSIGKSRTAIDVHKEMLASGVAAHSFYYMTYLDVLRDAKEWVAGREAFQEAVDELFEPFCSCVSVGQRNVRLDVHGMSPGAAATAIEWTLRKASHHTFSKHSLVIVTGKQRTYSYEWNTLRESVVQVLNEMSVRWSPRGGGDDVGGGRLLVTNKDWHLFRRKAKIKTGRGGDGDGVALEAGLFRKHREEEEEEDEDE